MAELGYLTALRRDGGRLAEAVRDLRAPVPACPGWDVAELVWHTGEVHWFWQRIASGAVSGPDDYREPSRPAEGELVAWFAEGVEVLAGTLSALDPAEPRWTWGRPDAGFIQRRMALETAVHCWDALSAAGRDEPVERELAVDGIDEFLRFFLPDAPPAGFRTDVHLHATDGPGEWLVRPSGAGWSVTSEHTKATTAVRGTASDLLLLLWRRKGPEDVEVLGDARALEEFVDVSQLN
ncbi:maleylpyruvate isomerase family mycothiol-dependent enzyme [Amycolatopsis thermalba]|uniref:Maleylpyruvate isomerase family mycothiol-dependent enzyme n=1 Tax=Amycolatopsis thermalba TaxID=944492 RepID=A0ABY4NSK9_9PSEU|nr:MULTISPECIES: maleylpyruvate isomerase family mycothiol-dependent enzyme [Amycolatopsis]UQS23050.1 maleylpyruvate isomerase family mycothiol-dependent enzyme [Amycolatopsis thermalba]